jgi:hypothetical protein
MVRSAARRPLVHWAREGYLVSERRACRAVARCDASVSRCTGS